MSVHTICVHDAKVVLFPLIFEIVGRPLTEPPRLVILFVVALTFRLENEVGVNLDELLSRVLREVAILEGEPRTVDRVRVRGIVIRIHASDTAIRIRAAVRPLNHTSSLLASARFLFSLKGGGGLFCPPLLSDCRQRFERRHAFRFDALTSEGEPRTAVRVRARGIVIRIHASDTATRTRAVVRPQNHTS